MKSSIKDSTVSSRGSRMRGDRQSRQASVGRRSKSSVSSKGDDIALEQVRTKWKEICEDEGVTAIIPVTRMPPNSKPIPRLEEKRLCIKIIMQEEEMPTELHIEGEIVEREIFSATCTLFSSYTSLTVLRLIDCRLRSEAITILGNTIADFNIVKEVYLDLNPVDGEDYSPLLTENSLEVLSLKGCDITSRGAELIASKLSLKNLHLKVLNLNTNLIDCAGAKHIAKGLKWNSRLICLCLAGNVIGNEGAISLASALMNFTLEKEDIEERKIRLHERADLIIQIVKERKEDFLSHIPPMPSLPQLDFPVSRKNKKPNLSLHDDRLLLSKVKVKTSSSRLSVEPKKSAVLKKEKSKQSITPLRNKSRASMRPARSITTATSEIGDVMWKSEEVVFTSGPDVSDDDSVTDFSHYSEELKEDWDKAHVEKKYKEKMLSILCKDVGTELGKDIAFQDPLLSRVYYEPMKGQLCSRGNFSLTHLNIAYNRIGEECVGPFLDLLSYQGRVQMPTEKGGIKLLLLKVKPAAQTNFKLYCRGNPIPSQHLLQIEMYLNPSHNSLDLKTNEV